MILASFADAIQRQLRPKDRGRGSIPGPATIPPEVRLTDYRNSDLTPDQVSFSVAMMHGGRLV